MASYSLSCFFFFFNDTATTEIYTLSLHDALPICAGAGAADFVEPGRSTMVFSKSAALACPAGASFTYLSLRSEEHTSELQSLTNLVCRLLLEKKKIHKSLWS